MPSAVRGALEMLATVLAVTEDIAPPTINYLGPDPECDLDYVPNTARKMKIDAALNNSFAFGGLNAVVAVKKASSRLQLVFAPDHEQAARGHHGAARDQMLARQLATIKYNWRQHPR